MNNDLVLVDTSAWIEFYRSGASDSPTAREVQRLIATDAVVTTEPVILELARGVKGKKALKQLRETFSLFHLATVKEQVWSEAVDFAVRLKQRGANVPTVDLLICTVSIVYGLKLLHQDRHFLLVAEVLPLEQHQVRQHVTYWGNPTTSCPPVQAPW